MNPLKFDACAYSLANFRELIADGLNFRLMMERLAKEDPNKKDFRLLESLKEGELQRTP